MDSDKLVKDRTLVDKYHLGELLGEGRYSKVYHGRNLETGASVAIKVMKKENLEKTKMTRHVEREISAMRTLSHPNIVHLYEVISDDNRIYLVMEYVKGGDLVTKMSDQETELDDDTKKKYFQQLITVVDFCHSKGVYHRDLKPDNLLVDDNGNLKVVDFGLSAMKEKAGEDLLFRTLCGTFGFIAPEVLNSKPYDGAKADIWSCGVILFYLMSGGYLPFNEKELMPLYRQICNRDFTFPLEFFDGGVASLLLQMLDPNPNTRITIQQIMEFPWFNCKDEASCSEPKSPCLNQNPFPLVSSSFNESDPFAVSGEQENERVLRFASEQPISTIVSRLEEIGKAKGFSVRTGDDKVEMEETNVGGEGRLSVCAEIYKFSSSVCTVHVRQTGGDTPEYEKFRDQDLKPGLLDMTLQGFYE